MKPELVALSARILGYASVDTTRIKFYFDRRETVLRLAHQRSIFRGVLCQSSIWKYFVDSVATTSCCLDTSQLFQLGGDIPPVPLQNDMRILRRDRDLVLNA